MSFGNINWLYAFIPVLALLILSFFYTQKVRSSLFKTFIAPNLLPTLTSSFSYRRYYLKSFLIILAIFFIFLALAQPRWGYTSEEQKSKGIDILFAVDVSKSMLAEDIKPNRLERAKYSILDLVKKLHGNRFGLIAFSGIAFLQCPLTLDYSAFSECLKEINPSVLSRGGTNISAAIRTAVPVFSKENSNKILILISDGEDLEASGISEAQIAAKDNIKIYSVGVGTSSGELIPIKNADNSSDFLRDTQGKIVKTRLDEETLSKIAEVTGGYYSPLGPKGEGLENIYQTIINNTPNQELTSTVRQVPIERFQWPLGIAIFLFILEMLLSTRSKSRTKLAQYGVNLILISFLLSFFSNTLSASPAKAYKAFSSNKFEEASALYKKEIQKNPENPSLNYNLGTSLYKSHNYNESLSALNKALKTQELPLQQKTFYNIGNTLYRKGQAIHQSDPQKAIELWQEAVKHYQSALELDPKDSQTQDNIGFVKKKIEELKENQEEQKDQQSQKEQDQSQKDNSSTDQNSKEEDLQKTDSQKGDQEKSQSSDSTQPQELLPNEKSKNFESPNNHADSNEQYKEQNKLEESNQNTNSSKDPNESKEDEKSSTNSYTRTTSRTSMTKEEAEEILKAFQNYEQQLPAVNERTNLNPYIDNFKDW